MRDVAVVLGGPTPALEGLDTVALGETDVPSLAAEDAQAGAAELLARLPAGARLAGAVVVAPRSDPPEPAMRELFLWSRVAAAALLERGAGALILVLPAGLSETGDVAGAAVVHGAIGLMRSINASLAPRGVRCLALARPGADGAVFAATCAYLLSDEAAWISGYLLDAGPHTLTLFTNDEPRWQLFAEPRLDDHWLAIVEDHLEAP